MAMRRRKLFWILGSLAFVFVVVPGVALFLLAIDEEPPAVDDLLLVRRDVADAENARIVLGLQLGEVKWPPFWSDEPSAGGEAGDDVTDAPAGDADSIEEEYVRAESAEFDEDAAQRLLEFNGDVLRRFDRALEVSDFQFAAFEDVSEIRPDLLHYRDLMYVLSTRARLALERGDAAHALEELRAILVLGRWLQEGQGALIHQFVGSTIQRFALGCLLDFLPRLSLGADDLRTTIATIEAEVPSAEALQDTLRVEFELADRILRSAARGSLKELESVTGSDESWKAIVVRPFLLPNQTRRLLAEHLRAIIEAVDRSLAHRPSVDVVERLRRRTWTSWLRNGFGKQLLALVLVGQDAVLSDRGHVVATARAAQTIIALHGYRDAHGELPRSLGELVPEWLNEVPLDPFSGDPLRYDRERGIVYSVGNDREDGGGSKQSPRWARTDRDEPTFTIEPPEFRVNDDDGVDR